MLHIPLNDDEYTPPVIDLAPLVRRVIDVIVPRRYTMTETMAMHLLAFMRGPDSLEPVTFRFIRCGLDGRYCVRNQADLN